MLRISDEARRFLPRAEYSEHGSSLPNALTSPVGKIGVSRVVSGRYGKLRSHLDRTVSFWEP